MRPRCCFRYFTFFGINMTKPFATMNAKPAKAAKKIWLCALCGLCVPRSLRSCLRPPRRPLSIFFFAAALRYEPFTFVKPDLDSDLPVGRIGFREAVVDVRAERLQRQLAV